MKIIFATGNKNKMTEIRQILRDLGMEILSMKEAGVDIDIVEDGKSFEENAMIKASAIAELPEVRRWMRLCWQMIPDWKSII